MLGEIMRRLLNVSRERQLELESLFPWLHSVHGNDNTTARMLSVSVFDHWLTREEACAQLEDVPTEEQHRRNALHTTLCARIARETEVLSFVFRRRQRDRLVFRGFASSAPLCAYFSPNGGKTLRHRRFHVVLPELRCAFYEGWDDTNHFYFSEGTQINRIVDWVNESGLHILENT